MQKNTKFDPMERDVLLKFWDPICTSGTAETTNFKFGKLIDHKKCHHKNKNYVK